MASNTAVGGFTAVSRADFEKRIEGFLKQAPFNSTIARTQNIVPIMLALFFFESSLNPNKTSPQNPATFGTIGYDYMNSTPIREIVASSDPSPEMALKKKRVYEALSAFGLGQVLGLNFIRGASAKNGKSELERAGADSSLLLDPGDDLVAHVLGPDRLDIAIKSSLYILHLKWQAASLLSGGTWGFVLGSRKVEFNSRIAAAVGAYLGLGAKGDINGTTSKLYSASIVGGAAYKIANGGSYQVLNFTSDPRQVAGTNGSDSPRATTPGCS